MQRRNFRIQAARVDINGYSLQEIALHKMKIKKNGAIYLDLSAGEKF